MRNVLILSFVMFIITLTSSEYSYSQFQCPPDTGINCSPWEIGIYVANTETPGCELRINYRWRNCDMNYQIYIDNVQKSGNCDYLYEGIGAAAFQEWIDLVMIEEVAELSLHYPPANCPGSSQKVIFYTATCGLWVKCEYSIEETERECDPDWRGEYPDYSAGGTRKVNLWRWQSCGVTCCRKEYSICRKFAPSGEYSIQIQSLIKTQIGDCSNPEGFVQPCQSGC